MRKLKWLVATILITVVGALLLIMINPSIKGEHKPAGYHYVEVFSQDPIQQLSNYNIVDWLIDLPIEQKLGRVEWSNQLLLVELHVDSFKLQPYEWFADVQELISASFMQLSNVERVLIRMLEPKELGKQLLATVDVRRSDSWLQDSQVVAELKYRNPLYDPIWRERLRVNITSVWKEKFGTPKI